MNDNFDLAAMRRMATLITPFAGQAILQCCDEIERWQARASLAQPSSVPAGWKLVPVEPTEAMFTAVSRHLDGGVYVGQFLSAYRSMLAAAPSAPQPEAQAPGFALVQIAELTKWKSLANSLAVLSLKSERATTAIILKSLIQDAIDAAPSAQAEPQKPNYRAECWPESPHNKRAEQGGK